MISEVINELFLEIHSIPILLHEGIEDEDIYIIHIHGEILFYNLKDICINGEFKDRFFHDNSIKKTTYPDSILKINQYMCQSILFPLLKWNDNKISNLFQFDHSKYFINNQYISSYFIQKLKKINNSYRLVYYANRKLLKLILLDMKCDHWMSYFISLLYENIKCSMIGDCEDKLDNILNIIPKSKHKGCDIIVNLKDNIKLFDYQIEDIKWMNNITEMVDKNKNSISLNYTTVYNITLDKIKYLLYDRKLIPYVDVNLTNKYVLKFYGGNIITTVGLGKSMIVLSYLLQYFHPCNFIEFDNNYCNYFFKRGKNTGTCCNKLHEQDSLYCKEHSCTIFIDKRKTILKNTEVFNLKKYILKINNKNLFKTNASLILCPNQLCDQWVREYYDKFKQNEMSKRIILVVTYDQYKNITLSDILFADIIVISYNFLVNINYAKPNFIRNDINIILTQMGDLPILDILNTTNSELNLFDNFFYENVCLDESHEISMKPKSDILIKTIKNFQSKYKWNISATPFSHGIISFFNNLNHITNNASDISRIDSNTIDDLGFLYRRNTRESVKNEFSGNIITKKVKKLEFTDQERRIYDAYNYIKTNKDFLVKLCCDTSIDLETKNLVKNCKTLSEIESVILNFNKKKLIIIKKKISLNNNKIEELSIIVNRGFVINELDCTDNIFNDIDEVKAEISIYKRRITADNKEYDIINRTYNYLKTAIDNIKEIETCPICLDDITKIAITKCGHKFCRECIYEYIESNDKCRDLKCPKCNIYINLNEIYILQEDYKTVVNDNTPELNKLIQKIKSTKIGNIIHYIKNEMVIGDKCIIFSQWDSILTKVGNILQKQNLSVMYCSGTVYQRKNAIKNFQEKEDCNIICLSSDNCASGINLTSANKIIFIEPIYGTYQYRKDTENQGTARSDRIGQKRPIEIIKFIIKNTIEEEIEQENN